MLDLGDFAVESVSQQCNESLDLLLVPVFEAGVIFFFALNDVVLVDSPAHEQVLALLVNGELDLFGDKVVVLSDDSGLLAVVLVHALLLHVRIDLAHDGDEQVEHHDHHQQRTHDHHQSCCRLVVLVEVVDGHVPQNHRVSEEARVHKPDYGLLCEADSTLVVVQHYGVRLVLEACEGVSEAHYGEEEHEEESAHTYCDFGNHPYEVRSVFVDSEEVQQL